VAFPFISLEWRDFVWQRRPLDFCIEERGGRISGRKQVIIVDGFGFGV
jgi:hypothetical protein